MFCFTFVSDHNTDSLMYSVQLKNIYSYLNSSLKLSDIVRGLSCQQLYCNVLSLYKLIIIIPFILSYEFLLFSIHIIRLMHSFEVNIRICQPENSDVHRGEVKNQIKPS